MNQKYSLQNNTVLIPFGAMGPKNDFKASQDNLENKETPRSIRLPKLLWKALDNDAKANKRSSIKQLEAILSVYFGLAPVETISSRFAKVLLESTDKHDVSNKVFSLGGGSSLEDSTNSDESHLLENAIVHKNKRKKEAS